MILFCIVTCVFLINRFLPRVVVVVVVVVVGCKCSRQSWWWSLL